MIKAVFDTNILVSHFITGKGKPAKVVSLFYDGQVETADPVIS